MSRSSALSPRSDASLPPSFANVLSSLQVLAALPSHQKRKVKKRAAFLEKIRVATASKLKKSPGKHRRGGGKGLSSASLDFATLEATLGEIGVRASGAKSTSAFPRRTKLGAKLVDAETNRMRAVLRHDAFRRDPVAAVTNHVLAALQAEKPSSRAGAASSGTASSGALTGAEMRAASAAKRRERRTREAADAEAAKEASDAVAAANAARVSAASKRGITHRGVDDRRAPKEQIGVRHAPNKAKKGAGGKKGSKRSKKRRQEEW